VTQAGVLTLDVLPNFTGFAEKLTAESKVAASGAEGGFAKVGAVAAAATAAVTVAVVAVGVASIKMAADFQTSMTQLVTGAGESQKNIKLVGDGLLAMAGQVGISAQELSKGMYLIESAGFHGAAGLVVLKAAAEGAAVGNADMGTVADAVTTILHDYHLGASGATSATNFLVAAVANGKTHMQDLAASLGSILPVAASLGVPLSQVGGAMATMTNAGIPASRAATSLRFAIVALINPTKAASDEMKAAGISSEQVGALMSKGNFAGALALISNAALKFGKEGSAGYLAAMAKMVGGTRGLQSALALTGKNAADFQTHIAAVGAGSATAGKDVTGFALVQKDLNFQMAQVGATLKTWLVELGSFLIPYLEKGITWVQNFTKSMSAHGSVMNQTVIPAVRSFVEWLVVHLFPTVVKIATVLRTDFANGIKAIQKAFEDNRPAIMGFLSIVKDVATWIIDHLVPVLAIMWEKQFPAILAAVKAVIAIFGFMVKAGANLVALLVNGFRILAEAVINALGLIVNGAANAFGWIPGLGPKLKTAQAAFNTWSTNVKGSLDTAAAKAKAFSDQVNGIPTKKNIAINFSVSGAVTAFNALVAQPGGLGVVKLNVQQVLSSSKPHGATGGLFVGTGGPKSDSISAQVSPGELLLNAQTVQKVGANKLLRLNAGQDVGLGGASHVTYVTVTESDAGRIAAAITAANRQQALLYPVGR
jgi:TP901 family phage tail tape measure protein